MFIVLWKGLKYSISWSLKMVPMSIVKYSGRNTQHLNDESDTVHDDVNVLDFLVIDVIIVK